MYTERVVDEGILSVCSSVEFRYCFKIQARIYSAPDAPLLLFLKTERRYEILRQSLSNYGAIECNDKLISGTNNRHINIAR